MPRISIRFWILTLLLVLCSVPPVVLGQSSHTDTSVIEIDVAQFVADEYVHKYYPEFHWINVDHVVIHDIEGSVAAYAFIFSKASSSLRSASDLRNHIIEKTTELKQTRVIVNEGDVLDDQEKKRVISIEEELYNFNNLASIITGATSDSKLILRHFRGLPEFWVESQSLDEDSSSKRFGKALRVFRVIMITPMDFRIVAIEGAATVPATSELRSPAKVLMPDSAYCLHLRKNKAEKISKVRKEREAIANRKQKRLSTLEPAERAQYEKTLQERARAMANRWQKYREMQAIQRTLEEVVQ